MKWFKKDLQEMPELPEINEILVLLPAISEYLDAFRLPDAFKEFNSDTLPVIDLTGKIAGIVSEHDLAKIMPALSFSIEGYMQHVSVKDIMTRKVWTETEHTNIKDLLTSVPEMHIRVIPVVNESGIYTGYCITRTEIINFLTKMVKPLSLGGLATPLGVYLTDGLHQAGAKTPGLILNGIIFAFIVVFINFAYSLILNYITIPEVFESFVQLFIFLILLRFTPYSKIHAAEHKTINAIEKGMPLTLETVKMQSRVHDRCGTNLMVFIFGIVTVISLINAFIPQENIIYRYISALFGFFFILNNWKNMGRWTQKYFTTSEPTENQIKNGIRAGEEILKLHKQDTRNVHPNFSSKLWNMGFFQVIITFMATVWLIDTYMIKFITNLL